MYTYTLYDFIDDARTKWNDKADEYNQWDTLSLLEQFDLLKAELELED